MNLIPTPNLMPKPRLLFLLCTGLVFETGGVLAHGPAAKTLAFSERPTDAELFAAAVLDEPLVPLDGEARMDENQALAAALQAYATRAIPDDCSSLSEFAESYPSSRWTGPLLVHLGAEYYNYGYYTKALDAWERAWARCRDVHSGAAKPEADRALGELARMYSRIGRMTDLSNLLDSTTNRDLAGPGTQLIHAARSVLWMMQNKPDHWFECGPLALDRILLRLDPSKAGNPLLLECKSTTNGFSLSQVAEISQKLGMNYQMAFREPGATFIVPAVVNWKVSHYAALVERRDDRILAQDYTFRGSVWLTTNALEEEASGYFLVPSGPLPRGWRSVSTAEGQSVWGKGPVNGEDPNGTSGADTTCGGASCSKCRPCQEGKSGGMTTYSMHAMLVSLSLQDTPVGFPSPVGPQTSFTAEYHQLEANQPAIFHYSNLGAKWTCNWITYITDNPTSPNADVTLYVDGGGTFNYTSFNPVNGTYLLEPMSQSLLVKTGTNTYEMQYRDGSRREYTVSDGSIGSTRRIFLAQVIDPSGNTVQINYDSQLRITNIVNAIGQPMTLLYTNATYPFAITSVVDPFGRTAYFQYNTNGLLAQITDVLGLTSSYTYGANQFVSALTTPYGTTTFTSGTIDGGTNFFLTATDPLGGTEALEYSQALPVPASLPALEVPHGLSTFNLFMNARDSFFWDKKAFAEGAWDWRKAHIYHWLHESPSGNLASRILESEKEPLEGRIWYNYPGQSTNMGAPYYLDAAYSGASDQPSVVARVLDDGTTQLSTYAYNAMGNITNATDAVGRNFTYVYGSNNVDLLEMRMTHHGKNELLLAKTYNAQHQPLTVTDASGQTTTYTYTSRGQIQTLTDPKNETITFTYDTNSHVVAIAGPLPGTNDTATFTYDAFNRIQTTTDTEGYTVNFSYDNFDRTTSKTYPDGTSEHYVYNRLDLVASQDRMGRWTSNTYNPDRQLISTVDPIGQINRFDWCNCGLLEAITDPMGRTTSWTYDLQGRVTAKQYADGSEETYTYENSTSRLQLVEDQSGQQTASVYYADNTLKSLSYVNSINPTGGVAYTYDSDYNRISTVQDATGTTTYTYHPITPGPVLGAGKIQSVSGPLPNSTVNYLYDQLGRVVSRSINGVAQASSYDSLNRLVSVTNAMGAFIYSYDSATERLASAAYPNGQSNLYSYYSNLGDQRLRQISNFKPDGSLLSSFGYTYAADGQINSWTNQWDTLPSRVWQMTSDGVHQLTNAVRTDGASPVSTNSYAYDAAGNRVVATANGNTNQSSFNALNQITDASSPLTNGATYEWDAAHRLTAVTQGAHRSEFSYDGWDRRVRIVEKANGAVVADNRFLWCGTELCEERDAAGSTVVKRFFPQGEVILGAGGPTNLFYTRDHLGSIREAVDSSGILQTRYDYDPYGQQSVLAENTAPSFAFTGQFQHRPTGLYLTLYRALDPRHGRWLSRDPSGEVAGFNLYAYVGNNPVNAVDPYGLFIMGITASAEAEAGGGPGVGGQVSIGQGIVSGNSPLEILGTVGIVAAFINPVTAPFAIQALIADRIQAKVRGKKPVFGIGAFVSDGIVVPLPCKHRVGTAGPFPFTVPYAVGPGIVGGASAGAGVGLFFSNATDFSQLSGPFLTWNLNTPIFGISIGVDPSSGTFIVSGTGGPPTLGVSSSLYITNTKSGQF